MFPKAVSTYPVYNHAQQSWMPKSFIVKTEIAEKVMLTNIDFKKEKCITQNGYKKIRSIFRFSAKEGITKQKGNT